MNIANIFEQVPDFKGTFFEDFFRLLEDPSGIDTRLDPVAENEVVVGTMTPVEKTFYMLTRFYRQLESQVIDSLQELQEETPEFNALRYRLDSARERFRVSQVLLWDSIEARLAASDTDQFGGWGVRERDQIVLLSKRKEQSQQFHGGIIIGGIIAPSHFLDLFRILE